MGNQLSLCTSKNKEQHREITNESAKCHCLSDAGFIKNNPVPLKSVSVEVRIDGFIANVQSTLIYQNTSKDPIEVFYEFPMDDQSAVYHFEAQIEDRVIIAECQEKKQAKETYDDAVKEGYGAVLMQEDDSASDIFSCLVGNLPPDADATIKFGYVTELSLQPDGVLTFLLPTILNPRYNPSVESGGSANPSDATYVPQGEEQPYKFEIKITIINPAKISSVKAKQDELDVKLSDERTQAEVSLVKPFVANHDFTLDVSFEEVTKPHIIVEKGDESKDGILKKDVVMLNFFPELKDSDYSSKHEFIFVIDRSGSMTGSRIEMAKETLLLFLKSLPPGCYFNIIGFGSDFEVLFPDGSCEYSEESLKVATELQQKMDADLGGTEILEPLKHIYDKPTLPTHSRQILLFTDGDVMNAQAIIKLVRNNANNTRLFSFGIGEGASTSLVKGIARAGRGRAEFTKEGERLQPLVVKTLKAAMQLSVTDLHLDWELGGTSPDVVQLPKDLPPLFAGERLIIYAMTMSDKVVLDGKVHLKGKIGERTLEFGLDVDFAKNVSSKAESLPIHRLAAKAQIKQLQDSGKKASKASIVLLSTAANVISCHTSMVGVDKDRKERIVGDLVRKNVPLMQCSSGLRSMSAFKSLSSTPNAKVTYKSCKPKTRLLQTSFHLRSKRDLPSQECMRMNLSSLSARSTDSVGVYKWKEGGVNPKNSKFDELTLPCHSLEPTYMSVVSLQKFSGEWKLDEELAEVLKTSLDTLEKAAPVKAQNVWATVLALSYLETKFSDKRDEWEMIDSKARQWLDLQDREGHTVDDLMTKARAIVDHL